MLETRKPVNGGEPSDRLERLFMLLQRIPREPRRISTAELQQSLASAGFDVKLRTIQRDLEYLSTLFGLQCDDRDKPYGWSWLKTAPMLEMPGMSRHAALTFRLVETYLQDTLPASTLAFLSPYFKAAEAMLRDNPGKSLSQWADRIRIISPGPVLLPPAIDGAVHDAVYAAVLSQRQLQIGYQKLTDGQIWEYLVNPLALVVRDGVIYLICVFDGYRDSRQLALHRIKAAKVTDNEANTPEFDLDAYIAAGEFNVRCGPDIRLQCRFFTPHGLHLLETPLSADQTVTWENDGQFTLAATVPWSAALMRWLLGWSGNIEILEPADLREAYRKEIALMAKRVFEVAPIER